MLSEEDFTLQFDDNKITDVGFEPLVRKHPHKCSHKLILFPVH